MKRVKRTEQKKKILKEQFINYNWMRVVKLEIRVPIFYLDSNLVATSGLCTVHVQALSSKYRQSYTNPPLKFITL
jgi:hypothetical protein